MADGYRLPQNASNYFYSQHAQSIHQTRLLSRTSTPPRNRSHTHKTPSPPQSPDTYSPNQSLHGMYAQSHQQAQHGRVNGATGAQRMPLMYNYQHQSSHQQPAHNSHHQNLHQDHSAGAGNGTVLGHHASYSSGVLSNATPSFTPNSLQNGQNSTTTQNGQTQQVNEHWAEQLRLHKETARAHHAMVNEHAPNFYARTKGHENRSIGSIPLDSSGTMSGILVPEGDAIDRSRPSNVNGATTRQDWHNMDMSGQGLRVLTAPLFQYTFLNELYVASNRISELPPAIGKLRNLSYLDISNNLLTELPPELGMCTFLRHLLLFDNQIRTLPNELGSLYMLEMLGIEGNPLDAGLKQEIMENGTKALILRLREQAPVPLPPASRVMLDLQDGAPAGTNQDRFKVFSFNTLCERYATAQLYGYTPSSALAWEYRKELVLREIQASEADILCLQEVDGDNFKEFYSVKLAYNDYKGVYWPKGRSQTMSEKDAKAVDGCAIFYKASKYILLDKQVLNFTHLAIHRPDMKNQHDVFNRVMPRDDIAVVVFLENRMTGSRMIVVNLHIFWDPIFKDVKIIQIAVMMENLTKLAEKYARWPALKDKKPWTSSDPGESNTEGLDTTAPEPPLEPQPSVEYSGSTQIPLLVCGDFNSMEDSGVYELLAQGSLPPDHRDLGTHQYGNFTRDGIEHPFSLRSAYAALNGTPEALPFTNYTPGFVGVLDYIWYSTNALEVTALLGPIDNEYMKRVPGFPNYHFPSDHLSLLAEFSVKGTRKEKKALPEPDFSSQRERRA